MNEHDSTRSHIEEDIWAWIRGFVTVKNEFYGFKFAPCPFARQALEAQTVDVLVWQADDVREFIRRGAVEMHQSPRLTTRVMAFPPKTRFLWGLNDYVETLNAELIPDNVFLNTGVAQGTFSRYPGSAKTPYFIVIANSLAAVLAGAEALAKTDYYQNWPADHYALVVERRARLAKRYGTAQ